MQIGKKIILNTLDYLIVLIIMQTDGLIAAMMRLLKLLI